jgi:hypothetical protein
MHRPISDLEWAPAVRFLVAVSDHLRHHGMAVQVDPIKPKLKLPGAKRLKLKCDERLSKFAFKINLRRYVTGLRA